MGKLRFGLVKTLFSLDKNLSTQKHKIPLFFLLTNKGNQPSLATSYLILHQWFLIHDLKLFYIIWPKQPKKLWACRRGHKTGFATNFLQSSIHWRQTLVKNSRSLFWLTELFKKKNACNLKRFGRALDLNSIDTTLWNSNFLYAQPAFYNWFKIQNSCISASQNDLFLVKGN